MVLKHGLKRGFRPGKSRGVLCHRGSLDHTETGYICYASANIKALETLGYAEHICNYVVILDSWFYGKIHVLNT